MRAACLLLVGCYTAAPPTTKPVEARLAALGFSDAPVVNREARLVAGYHDAAATTGRVWFYAIGADNRDLTKGSADPEDPTARARLETQVGSWLAHGSFHRMILGRKRADGVWTFPGLVVTGKESDDGLAFYRSDQLFARSPENQDPISMHRGHAHCDLTGFRVRRLAYDPPSQLVWVEYEPIGASEPAACIWYAFVQGFQLHDVTKYPYELPD
jgi:hypothetical protein